MADIPLKSLTFPDLTDTYTIPEKLFESGTGTDSIKQVATNSANANTASGHQAIALGRKSVASGQASIAIGNKLDAVEWGTTASANGAIAIGASAKAAGALSVAIGQVAQTEDSMGFAFGNYSDAKASYSVAIGNRAISSGRACFVAGQYNVEDTNAVDTSHGNGARKYILIVGNGTAENARSNALTVDWDGNLVASGKMTVGTAPTTNMDVATKQYVDDNSGKVTEVTNSTTGAVSVALDPEKIYHFTGALTSLSPTLTAPANGHLAYYHFDFDSGSTAPTLTLPNTVTMPSGFTVAANKHYEIDILNNYGVVTAW